MTDQQDDVVGRLRNRNTPYGWLELADKAADEIERLQTALGQIAGKNDLSGVADDMIQSALCNALYECELIARDALSGYEQEPTK